MTGDPRSESRDSGVPWLGAVPAHWEVRRLKTCANTFTSPVDKVPDEDEEPVRLLNYTDVYYNDRVQPDMDLMETTATPSEIRRFGLRTDDVVITKDSEDPTDIGVPALVTATAPDFVCGYHLAVIRPDPEELDGAFLRWALASPAVNQHFRLAANGITRFGIPNRAVGETPVPLPPPAEQRAITAYLDRETARLDRLAALQGELLDRLAEKRRAAIARAVTRGLDPAAPTKPTAVDWLGDVPAHWKVNRLKWSATGCINGVWGDEPDGVDDLLCVRVADFDRVNFRVISAPETYRSIPLKQRATRQLEQGDLLLEKSGGGEHQPVGCVVEYAGEEPAVSSNFVARLRPAQGCVGRFWVYAHAVIYDAGLNVTCIKQSTGIQNLDADAYLSLPAPFPPEQEQRAIADHLDDMMERFDQTAAAVRRTQARLAEHRTALLTAAVTGRLDVPA